MNKTTNNKKRKVIVSYNENGHTLVECMKNVLKHKSIK